MGEITQQLPFRFEISTSTYANIDKIAKGMIVLSIGIRSRLEINWICRLQCIDLQFFTNTRDVYYTIASHTHIHRHKMIENEI